MGKPTEECISTAISSLDEKAAKSVKPIYTDCSIPAKLFFDIINTKDYALLGEGSIIELEKVFESIFDEYVEIDRNNKIINWYEKTKKIHFIQTTMNHINNLLYMIVYTPMTETQRESVVEILNTIPNVKCRFDLTKNVLSEVKRVQTSVLGSMRNQLKLLDANATVEETVKKYIYQQDIAKMSTILGFQINTGITMYEFVSYKHSSVEAINQRKKK